MTALDPRENVLEGNAFAERILTSATTIFEYVTTAETLSRDRATSREIRSRANLAGRRATLAYSPKGPFLHLLGDQVTGSSLEVPRGNTASIVDLQALFARDRTAYEALREGHERTEVLPEVAGWLRAFASGADEITRETFQAIAKWQPLIAVEAMRQLTHASMALDVERRPLLDAVRNGTASKPSLASYWTLIHLMSNDALLATMGDERAWLLELAAAVPPGRWTPSFGLVRERCMRLGLRAGWAASAFGEPIVPRYLSVLEPGVAPLLAFDAVLGLTAIGIRHSDLTRAIRRELRVALDAIEAAAPSEHRALLNGLARSADLAMTGSARVNLDVLNADGDCAVIEDGLFPCIVALASVVRAPAESLFHSASELEALRADKTRPAVSERAREVLVRTGIVPSAPFSGSASREHLN